MAFGQSDRTGENKRRPKENSTANKLQRVPKNRNKILTHQNFLMDLTQKTGNSNLLQKCNPLVTFLEMYKFDCFRPFEKDIVKITMVTTFILMIADGWQLRKIYYALKGVRECLRPPKQDSPPFPRVPLVAEASNSNKKRCGVEFTLRHQRENRRQ